VSCLKISDCILHTEYDNDNQSASVYRAETVTRNTCRGCTRSGYLPLSNTTQMCITQTYNLHLITLLQPHLY